MTEQLLLLGAVVLVGIIGGLIGFLLAQGAIALGTRLDKWMHGR